MQYDPVSKKYFQKHKAVRSAGCVGRVPLAMHWIMSGLAGSLEAQCHLIGGNRGREEGGVLADSGVLKAALREQGGPIKERSGYQSLCVAVRQRLWQEQRGSSN